MGIMTDIYVSYAFLVLLGFLFLGPVSPVTWVKTRITSKKIRGNSVTFALLEPG